MSLFDGDVDVLDFLMSIFIQMETIDQKPKDDSHGNRKICPYFNPATLFLKLCRIECLMSSLVMV
jgi:hypothetical protein